MVELAIILGIFSYLIFGMGISGVLEGSWLKMVSALLIAALFFLVFNKKSQFKLSAIFFKDKIAVFLLILLIVSALVNLLGALGPELGFDSLWYHLTIPKIYLQFHKIFFIPGGLFYYSAMPKLLEMIYLPSLVFSPLGTLAKLIHFSFGLFSGVALYGLAKKYLKQRAALLVVLVFYTTLIVGWESITAYVDLARTFFEILALKLFLEWESGDKDERKMLPLLESAMMLGLAISTKEIALLSLPIFLILILWKSKKIFLSAVYFVTTLIIALPWFIFSYVNTKNPFYPVFSGILDQSHKIVSFNLIRVFNDFWQLLFKPQDLISPVFLIFLPLVFLRVIKGKLRVELRVIFLYVILSLIGWYFTPRTGGSRFILPYLPALSLLIVGLVSEQGKFWKNILLIVCICSSIVNISYRLLANSKFLPVLLGHQSRNEFLAKRLDFKNGDFLDIDGNIGKIVQDELVLVKGSHNLFYADFPIVDSTYYKGLSLSKLPISYVLVQNGDDLNDPALGTLVYENYQTYVKLYVFKGL